MREDVVHRKLTADGEGVGDERRVMSVVNVGSYNGFLARMSRLQTIRTIQQGKATVQDAVKALKLVSLSFQLVHFRYFLA